MGDSLPAAREHLGALSRVSSSQASPHLFLGDRLPGLRDEPVGPEVLYPLPALLGHGFRGLWSTRLEVGVGMCRMHVDEILTTE